MRVLFVILLSKGQHIRLFTTKGWIKTSKGGLGDFKCIRHCECIKGVLIMS